MNSDRSTVGTVTAVSDGLIVLSLPSGRLSHVSGHDRGLASVTQPDDLLGFDLGTEVLITRVHELRLQDENERMFPESEPLRQLHLVPVGTLRRLGGRLTFSLAIRRLPALGAGAVGLANDEVAAITVGDSATTVAHKNP